MVDQPLDGRRAGKLMRRSPSCSSAVGAPESLAGTLPERLDGGVALHSEESGSESTRKLILPVALPSPAAEEERALKPAHPSKQPLQLIKATAHEVHISSHPRHPPAPPASQHGSRVASQHGSRVASRHGSRVASLRGPRGGMACVAAPVVYASSHQLHLLRAGWPVRRRRRRCHPPHATPEAAASSGPSSEKALQ